MKALCFALFRSLRKCQPYCLLFRGNFLFVVALTEESVILYDGLEIRPLSFGTGWVLIGYSLGWSPGKAPEIAADAVGKWEEPGRGWGGEAGLFGVDVFFERLFFSYLARVGIKKMPGKFVIKE